jgi:hypothetical protein
MASRAGNSTENTPKSTPKSTTRAKTTRAATGSKTAAKASAAAGKAPKAAVVTEAKAVVTGAELKKKELLDEVVERSGIKKKFAKPVVEAMIDVLGEAISEGREINLQPFGKLKHQRTKDTSNAQIIVAKIRQSKAAGPALDPADRADRADGENSLQDKVAQAGE